MNTKERFTRMYNHQEADRIPIIDDPWKGTIRRWKKEGMPVGMDWRDYFDVDKVENVTVDISPRYPENIIEETDRYIIHTTEWGVTLKTLKAEDSTPEFLDYKVCTPEAWEAAKQRMAFDPSRVDLNRWKKAVSQWSADGRWVRACFWFGFDVTHSWMVGTETLLMALIEQPEWVKDMFDTYLTRCIQYFEYLWDNGIRFDEISWPDDMGYKGTQFFSLDTYRTLLKPFHARAAEWAHNRGIRVHLHSCGNVMPLIPDLLDAGIDSLNPLEVKAGMDPISLKRDYGDKLVLHGGINAVLWNQKDAIIEEINRTVPHLKANGGYIFSSDHSIPNSVGLDTFRTIVAQVKQAGKY